MVNAIKLRLLLFAYICNQVAFMNITTTEQAPESSSSDKAGIASAVLCTIHCLIIPVFFAIKFWWADKYVLTLPDWWSKLDYLFLSISFLAVYHSATHTRFAAIKAALWVFWAALATAIVFEASLHWLAYIASAGLIVTHYLNIRRLRTMSKN